MNPRATVLLRRRERLVQRSGHLRRALTRVSGLCSRTISPLLAACLPRLASLPHWPCKPLVYCASGA